MHNLMYFIIFVLAALTVYSGLNYYFYNNFRKHYNKQAKYICILILSPFAAVLSVHFDLGLTSTILTTTAYIWVSFLFFFLTFYSLAYLISKVLRYHKQKLLFNSIVILNFLIIIYSFLEADTIHVKKLELRSPKINREISIVQISDIHFSPVNGLRTAKKIVSIIEDLKPDILISTGDFLDKGIINKKEISKLFKQIKTKYGKFAITGNHEFISGIEYSTAFIEQSGFELLRNKEVNIDDISLFGVDDITGKRFIDNFKIADEAELLKNKNKNIYRILLKHQPGINNKSTAYFDLQLSGHTHAGQIFPFTLLVKIAFPYLCGLYEINNNTKLYVSRGTGTWGPPIRFLAPPEITYIILKPVQ